MDLETRIRQAFADVPYPGEDALTSHAPCLECEGVAKALAGRTWASLSPRDVCLVKQALPLLSAEAFRYYLPAFMLGCIEDRLQVDTAWDNLVLSLRPHTGSVFETLASAFSEAQADAIGAFLEWQAEIEREDCAAVGFARPDDARHARSIAYWKARGGMIRRFQD